MTALQIGAPALDFTLPRDGGGTVSLHDFRGRPVVVYFYPKDDTPGCTKEAVAFSDAVAAFAKAGAAVIGISKDSVARHDKFRDKYGLKVILAADVNGETCEAYGVWVEKTLYGRKYLGIERATFLIDAAGRLAKIWRLVKVPGHVDDVLSSLEEA